MWEFRDYLKSWRGIQPIIPVVPNSSFPRKRETRIR